MADHGTAYAASRRHPAAASAARRQSERPQTFMVPIACRPYTLRRQWAQTSLLADGVREDRGMILVLPAPPRRRGRGGGEARTQRRQTRGQLTTSEVFCSVTRPEAAAFLIAAYDLSRRGVAPGFHVTLMIDHSGGYAVCPAAIVAPVTLCWPATPFVTA